MSNWLSKYTSSRYIVIWYWPKTSFKPFTFTYTYICTLLRFNNIKCSNDKIWLITLFYYILGRRGSEDFGELPPSPPLHRTTSMNKVKDRSRLRPRLPRCQSRQSTLDSTSTDEFDCAKEIEIIEVHNLKHNQNEQIFELQKKLTNAEEEIRNLEEKIARFVWKQKNIHFICILRWTTVDYSIF